MKPNPSLIQLENNSMQPNDALFNSWHVSISLNLKQPNNQSCWLML